MSENKFVQPDYQKLVEAVVIDQFSGVGPNQVHRKVQFEDLKETVRERPTLFEGSMKRAPVICELPKDVKLAVRNVNVPMGVTVYRAGADGLAEQWFCRWDS